jgi:DNA polymerase-1
MRLIISLDCQGVGDKTAKKFLAQYGSMEELLANTADLKGKLKEKIEANKALGLLSKKLARIMLDVPVQFDAMTINYLIPIYLQLVSCFKSWSSDV